MNDTYVQMNKKRKKFARAMVIPKKLHTHCRIHHDVCFIIFIRRLYETYSNATYMLNDSNISYFHISQLEQQAQQKVGQHSCYERENKDKVIPFINTISA